MANENHTMQVIQSLRICADEAFKRATGTVSRLDEIDAKIASVHEGMRTGVWTALRGKARVAELEADRADVVQEFKSWLSERVKTPAETFGRVYTLDPEKVDAKLVAVLPHMDLTEAEARGLLDGYMAQDDYASWRFTASCCRERGMAVSDPLPEMRKAVMDALEMVGGFTTGIVTDSNGNGPVNPVTRKKRTAPAYRGHIPALMEKVQEAIDKVERTAHTFTIGKTVAFVPVPKKGADDIDGDSEKGE